MDFSIDDDVRSIRSAVRELCAQFGGEYWQGLEPSTYPTEFVQELTRNGWLAALIPEEYGGSGLQISHAGAILEEICASGANAGACHAQMYVMGTVLRHGSDEQKARWLPQVASGELRLQAFAVTEPNVGSDTTKIQTRAKKVDGGYSVTGQKIWTSRAEHSDLMVLLARTTPIGEVQKKTAGLSTFLVDMREVLGKGLTITPIKTMVNHSTTELFFDDMFIPDDALIGVEGEGFKQILSGMNAERIMIASECVGDGRYFVEKAAAYGGERQVFGRPIGSNQGIQFPIAKAHAQIEAASLMRHKAAWLYESDQPCGAEANMAKLLASEASWAAANACMDTYGGFAFAEEYDIGRKFRETRLYSIAPVSNNLVLSHIGQHVLGMPRSF
jgi:acyl-CoA dehydrogenase